MNRFIIALLAIFALAATTKHEYYVSVTHADYNAESKTLEVGIKLFTDDLERTILENTEEPLKLSEAADFDEAEDFFAEYLEKHFLVMQNGKLKELTFVGAEPGIDETWLFAEVKMEASGTFTFMHTVLFDVFPDQINILHLSANGKEQSHYFNADKSQIDITL